MTAIAMPLEASMGTRVFRASLALFIAIVVARIPDIVPHLAALHLGKLLTLPMLITAVVAMPRWQLLFALRQTTAKAVVVIAVLSALTLPTSIWASYSAVLFTDGFLPGLVLFLLTSSGLADRATARVCVFAFVLAVAADAAYVLVGPAPEKMGRAYIGESLDPNESAALFVTTIPLAVLLASEGGFLKKWFGVAVAVLLATATVRTGSRGGAVGLAVVAAALIYTTRSRRRWLYIIGIVASAGIVALAGNNSSSARLRTLIAPTSDYNYTDREGRVQIWSRGLRYMLMRPLVGVGLGNFETAEGVLSEKATQSFGIRYTAPHNAFIQIGAELGVIGLAAFVVAIASALRGCRRIQRRASHELNKSVGAEYEASLATAACCALLGLVTTAVFLSLAYHPITLFALAICTAVQAGSPYAWSGRQIMARSPRAWRFAH